MYQSGAMTAEACKLIADALLKAIETASQDMPADTFNLLTSMQMEFADPDKYLIVLDDE